METERLILRDYKKEDFDDFYEYVSNPDVVKYEPYEAMTRKEAEDNLNYRITNPEFIAVELKATRKLIGNIYFGKRDFNTIEIGYVFNDIYHKKGYATESCNALIQDAFKNHVHRIYAECDPENTASWKLLERLGFKREAHLEKNIYFKTDSENKPIWKDTYIYSLLNEKG